MEQDIIENIGRVRACLREGVTLVAVSKTRTAQEAKTAYDTGIRDFGENRVQEMLEKKPMLPDDVRWHLIGSLQTNKVRKVVGEAYLIHSLDRPELALAIEKESAKKDMVTDCLIEINIGCEESKSGVLPEGLDDLAELARSLAHIRIRGLMAIIPRGTTEENREYFRRMKQTFDDLKRKESENFRMEILSMGMTNDYVTAMEEGSTLVRVGEGIFGERDKNRGGNKNG
ncbi:YggS family pyridoxal phosphate-dependent enzyme [Youngiibacter fragilis]|uniref:Pyridoxal phosphate homeostasis protein n=1 Tax=Youngiibacter fragilis 232.1 TaxID=994573 RepID=V7I857_9CLOT|nr:YggS family pyridoxal phosphate-dependent enzyme [Youngiibacter fragilis]ETA82063.1 hypothetical protein T472_0203620 [Youngiibacter fragilis 232.1]